MKDFVIFNPIIKFCLPLGLSVCLWKLCLSVGLSVCGGFVSNWVCLYGCLSSLCLAWGLCVCLFVILMFGMGFVCVSVCWAYVCRWLGYM